MAQNLTPLVFHQSDKPQGEPQVGDLVTVRVFATVDGSPSTIPSSGRLERIHESSGTYFVRLGGLGVPKPYEIGDYIPRQREHITDWARA